MKLLKKTKSQKLFTLSAVVMLVFAFLFSSFNKNTSAKTVTKEGPMEHLTLDSFKEKICECGLNVPGNAE